MAFENLSPEQLEKLKACTSPEEALALAAEEEIEFTPEDLKQIAGGCAVCEWAMNYDSPLSGDTREDIDPTRAREAFRRGEIAYTELDA